MAKGRGQKRKRGTDDRLSSLSEPVIHQIMSLLSWKDATRMSALSDRFLSLYRSLTHIEFDFSTFVGNTAFEDHVVASLRRRSLTTDLYLERLSLVAPSSVNMSETLKYALMNNVREMIINCMYDCKLNKKKPAFPYFVFEESKSIKKLSLRGFHVEKKDFTIKSPLMEELTLTHSTAKSTTVNIACPKLKTVEFCKLDGFKKIKIHDSTARSLESFSFNHEFVDGAGFNCKHIVNLASCKSLKALELRSVDVEDTWFESNFLCLASLESLVVCTSHFWQFQKPVLPYFVFELTSIKKLSLCGFRVEQTDLMIESPLMEELTITNSTATNTTINISCPKLKTVKISNVSGVEKIQIHDKSARFLESFFFKVFLRCNDIANLASCKNLKSLELCNVDLEDTWFASNVFCLDLLESLVLKRSRSLRKMLMCSERLRSVKLVNCRKLGSVDLNAISLCQFDFTRERGYFREAGPCRIDLTKCPNVRELTLSGDVAVPTGVLTPKFEFLETLKLSSCKYVETLNVEANHLTYLELDSCSGLQGFDITAPNLAYFGYRGRILDTSLTCNVNTEFVANIRLIDKLFADKKESLRDFLSSFGHSKKLSLHFTTEEPLIYSSRWRSKLICPLNQLRHLSINLMSKTAPIDVIFESILWLVPLPQIISIRIGDTMDLKLKFYYHYCRVSDEMEHLKHITHCCSSSLVKCWRHNVMRVEIEGFSEQHERESLEKYFVRNANNAITVEHVNR